MPMISMMPPSLDSKATEAAGYRTAVILCCGYKLSSDILFALPRIRVSYDDTLEEISKKLPE